MVCSLNFTKKKLTDLGVSSNSRKYVYGLKINGLRLAITKDGEMI